MIDSTLIVVRSVELGLVELDLIDLAFSIGLIGIAIIISLWQKLKLEGQFLMSAGRTLLQLLVVGYILDIIFVLDNWLAVLGILTVMISIASVVAKNRIDKSLPNLLPYVWLSIFASVAVTLSYVIFVIVQPPNWYSPQYLIPLAGMLMGNAMTGASLAGDRLVSSIKQNYLSIETNLSLGATPKQAIFNYQKGAIFVGLMPILNNMLVVGLVSFPGMFTGQVLAGATPLNAASYQIMILFAIVLTNLIVTVLVTEGVYRRFFNSSYQLTL